MRVVWWLGGWDAGEMWWITQYAAAAAALVALVLCGSRKQLRSRPRTGLHSAHLAQHLPTSRRWHPQRVSFAKTTSNAVAQMRGGKAAKAAKGKPPRPPAAGEGGAAAAKQPAAAAAGGDRAQAAAAAADLGKPNPKLFVEGLPGATTAAMLEMLFQQFPGALFLLLGLTLVWRGAVGFRWAEDAAPWALLRLRLCSACALCPPPITRPPSTHACRLQGGDGGSCQARHRVC